MLEELNKTGTTIVIATHNETLLKKFGYPVLRLNDGELNVTAKRLENFEAAL